jgi:2-amino-4-hydroxy-6-hydroxymethyldihydropteridine diphosphokinase
MNYVYFSLGTNLGDRKKNIEEAIIRLKKFVRECRVSRIYATEPLYHIRQPEFLNAVVSGYVELPPLKLLTRTRGIENELGRKRDAKLRFGPRTIDLDILLYGDRVIRGKDMEVPHPRMHERKFVILPLIELDPFLRDPVGGELYWKYLLKISGQGVYFHSFSRYTLSRCQMFNST